MGQSGKYSSSSGGGAVLSSCFAYASVPQLNVTGDGTNYKDLFRTKLYVPTKLYIV